MDGKETPVHFEGKVEDQAMFSKKDGEDALQHNAVDWSAEEERLLVRQMDLRLLPMLCVVMGLSLIDRVNISSAYIVGMRDDLDLAVGSRYSLCLLVFFITYGLFELPSNVIIRRIGARIWLSSLVILWGVAVLGMGFAKDWTAILALRVLLGVFEAGLLPGAIFLISAWYTTFEIARRISGFFMVSLIASAFGPILAYGLSHVSTGSGLYSQGWRWIFIIEGAVTVAAGVGAFLLLGDFPEQAKWLSERNRHIALKRIQMERNNITTHSIGFLQALKYLLDWKLLVFCVMYMITATSIYSVAFFMPIILSEGMGFSYTTTLLLSTPPWIFCIIMAILGAFWSDKYRLRWPVIVFQCLNCIVGLFLILYVKTVGVRLLGTFLVTYGAQANGPMILTLSQNNTGHPNRKGVVSAAVIAAGAVGGVCGSTIFRSQDAPLYMPGMWASIGMQILYLCLISFITLHFRRQNRLADEGKIAELEGVPGFRYTL